MHGTMSFPTMENFEAASSRRLNRSTFALQLEGGIRFLLGLSGWTRFEEEVRELLCTLLGILRTESVVSEHVLLNCADAGVSGQSLSRTDAFVLGLFLLSLMSAKSNEEIFSNNDLDVLLASSFLTLRTMPTNLS